MRTHKAAVGMSEACFSCYPLLARAAKCARSSICRSRGCRQHSSLSSLQTLLSRPPPPLQWRLDCEVGFMCVKHGNIFRLNPPMRLFIGLCLKKKKKKTPRWVAPFSFARRWQTGIFHTEDWPLFCRTAVSLHGDKKTIFDNCSLLIDENRGCTRVDILYTFRTI